MHENKYNDIIKILFLSMYHMAFLAHTFCEEYEQQ